MLKLFVRDKKNNIHDCNVCFEAKDCTQCLKCKNCFVCQDCLLSMCENGICNKCPHCRQSEWRKSLKKSKIVPISVNNIIISEQRHTTTTSQYVYTSRRPRDERPSTIAFQSMTQRGRFYYRLMMICVMLCLSYMCGFITIIIITVKKVDQIDPHLISWVALTIGLFEVHCVTLCCFANVCKHPIKTKKDYCDMFCTME
uniref:RING-type domain-containing protein n=1 Tax=viral metagenome TaxID=1070528 RepID=A0A6C0CR73_9ZZZZ